MNDQEVQMLTDAGLIKRLLDEKDKHIAELQARWERCFCAYLHQIGLSDRESQLEIMRVVIRSYRKQKEPEK